MTILVQDSFNRANSTTGLGIADTEQSWSALSGVWGIQSNQAYWVSGTALSAVESNQSDVQISLTNVVSAKNQPSGAIAFRISDSSNYWFFRNLSGVYQIYKVVGGSATLVGSLTEDIDIGTHTLKLTANGSSIECYVNDVLKLSTTDTHNQTATKHGLRHHISTTTRFDNFVIESSGETPTGTDGSAAFDIRPSLYSDSFATSDTKQSLYGDSFVQTDVRQAIYSDSASAYDTRLNLHQDGANLFDTLQEFFSDGIVGSIPFDIRMVLYADNEAVFDSKQEFYTDGASGADLAQQFYQAGANSEDLTLVIYADASPKFDANQSLYSDSSVKADTAQRYYTEGTFDFDTLQAILEDWNEYHEVIRLVLNITQSKSATLGFTQRQQTELKM